MAEAVLTPPAERSSWLDRPLVPSWQRVVALAAHWELIAYGLILLVALGLRFWDLGSRAMHHDESLHAYYSWQFYVGRGYSYDPLMHGPFKFEIVPLFYLLFGSGEASARMLGALLGSALVVLPYFLRRTLTVPGALLAAVGLAISPSMVYYSRFIRDDIYLAFFTLLLFICLVHYLQRPRPAVLYTAAATFALAVTVMEAAYITAFIFGTFLIFEALREWLGNRTGPVIAAFKATSLDTWLAALAIFVVVIVVMYSTFFTNPYGIWDPRHPLTGPDSANRQDIIGGLTYWRAQQGVARGAQPWFYYLLTLPLYEQIAVVFGLAGIAYALVRRSMTRTFLVWWALLSWGIYTWAGEKMPWLTLHIALPLILLAGMAMGEVLRSRRTWRIVSAGGIFAVLLAVEVHSTFALNFIDGANPTEMLVYVQTSQDVPNVTSELRALSERRYGGTSMPIGIDSSDVGGWPFTWYLRDFPNAIDTTTFNAPACNGKWCPALVMLSPEFDANSRVLLQRYVAQKYRWNWWFPEDYKVWFPTHWNALLAGLQGKSTPGESALPTPSEWQSVWNWFIYRKPFGERGARVMYLLIRRDLVPGSKYFSTVQPGSITGTLTAGGPRLRSRLVTSIGLSGPTGARLSGPRAVATDSRGNMYVADTLNHRVVRFSPKGAFLGSFGSTGTASGQFSQRDSPQGLAVGPDGNVYVADTWNQRIEVFSRSGKFLRQWGGGAIGSANGQFYGPRSLAVAPNGKVYVADTGNKRVQVFSPTGRFLFAFGSAGTEDSQFNEPSAVAVSRTGEVYVADFWNQRVQVFTGSGRFIRSWRVADWTPNSYDEPYLAVSPTGERVFVADPAMQQVQEYTAGGKLVGNLTSTQFSLPIGVAAGRGSTVTVTDPTANRVGVYTVAAPRRGAARGVLERPTVTTRGAPKPGGQPNRP